MIQVQNLTKQFSGQVLFEDLSFNLQPGERIGLVGRNGSGKSTLFKMILGELAADAGEVVIPKNYTLGKLEQHIHFTKPTVLEECTQVLKEEEKFDYYKAEKILNGLGFTEEDYDKDPKSFSGGFQIRINLCKSLLIKPNLLLLDEPTNYLDILSLRWLRRFLRSFDGEVILITHDRSFMDSVTTHTMGIYRQGLKKIKGSTSKFYEQLEQEDEIYQKTKVNQDKKRAHLESFVEKFGAKASKATQAQSKMKQLAKLDQMDDLVYEASMGLKFEYLKCPSKTLMNANDLSFGYDSSDILFQNLNFQIGSTDRIGIIGKNGKGKSTLLNVLAGELKPLNGNITSHNSMKFGHLGQTNVKRLHDNSTILEEVQSSNPALPTTKIRQICGSMLFTGDHALKKVSVLSGGEKNRVMLAKILANPTNLLFLDEPTNHLDMESIAILTEELKVYEGAVVLVTHSEDLLRKVCNRLIIFHKDGAEFFMGGYDDFLSKIGWDEEEGETKKKAKPKFSKKEIHAKRQVIIKERSKACNPLKKKISEYEEKIIKEEEKLEDSNAKLAQASEEQNNELIIELSKDVADINIQIQKYFDELTEYETKFQKLFDEFEDQLKAIEN